MCEIKVCVKGEWMKISNGYNFKVKLEEMYFYWNRCCKVEWFVEM